MEPCREGSRTTLRRRIARPLGGRGVIRNRWFSARMTSRGGRPRSRVREYEHEARARRLARRWCAVLQPELAVHAARELGADRQAEAEAGRGRVLAPLEALEDRLAFVFGDARAAVEDAHLDVAVVALRAHLDRRLRRIADRVVDQQADDAGDALGVALRPAGRARRDPARALELGGDGAGELAELDRLAAQRGARVEA